MSCLAPCPGCQRHIASSETSCPFCAAALPDSFHCQPARALPPGRLSRAAMMAAGAALVTVQACASTTHYGTAIVPDASADTSTNDSAVALYGAAPAQFDETLPQTGDGTPPVKPERN